MIINLWSTPRTGSVWYSNFLKMKYPGSILLTEMFNQYHMDMYYTMKNGRRLTAHVFSPGFCHDEYSNVNGTITTKKIYSERTRTVVDEELYRIELFKQLDSAITLILHNHVAPINETIKQQLIDIADKNIYIYRKDKRAQLASYAIAFSTRQFIQFFDKQETGTVDDINCGHLENLINRIKIWDNIPKESSIAYEDIEFFNKDNWPKKQNTDYRLRLSQHMISMIDELVIEYEKDFINL